MANTTRTIYINGKEAEATLKGLTELASRFRNELRNAELGSEEYTKALSGLKQTNQILTQHTGELRGISKAYGGIMDGLSGIAGYAAAAFSVQSLISFGEKALSVANDFEQTNIAFQTMLGSKKDADELQAKLIDLAAKTPFELPQVQEASKKLLAFGFSAQEVIPNLTSLGNIAAGVGMEKLPQLILAFGQVKAATKLTGNELRQFTEAGVPLLDELAKQLKKPVSEIQKMVSEGAIGFPIVQKALTALSTEGGRFANLMEKQAQTLGGLWSTFKDNFTQNILLPLGNGLSNLVKPILQFAIGNQNAAESVMKLQSEFNSEINVLQRANTPMRVRKEIIEDINKRMGTYLPHLLTEKSSIEEIRKAQEEANKTFQKRIILLVAEEDLKKIHAERFELMKQETGLYKNLENAKESAAKGGDARGTYDIYQTELNRQTSAKLGVQMATKAIDEYNAKIASFDERLKQSIETAKKAGVDIDKILNDESKTKGGNTEGSDGMSKKDKKDIEHDEDKLKKLREHLITFQNDIQQLKESDYKEELKAVEKYEKQIAEVKKLYDSKDKAVRIGAATLVKELEGLKNKELEAITSKHLQTVVDELDKHQKELDNKKLSEDAKEAAEISDKYAKRLQAVLLVENGNEFATAAQKTKAHQLRLQIEAQRDAEINDAKEARRKEQQLKEDREWQERQLAEASEQEKEILDITLHYQKIFDTQNLSVEDSAKLAEEMGQRISAVNKKYRDKELKDEKAKNKELLTLKKDLATAQEQLELTKLKAAETSLSLIHGFLQKGSALSKAFFLLEKGFAIAQIIKNLQIEVAALRAASAIQQLQAAAIPGAGVIIEGITTAKISMSYINAGVGIATVAAQAIGEFVAPQKYEGGYTDVIGADDNRNYQAQLIGQPQTGLLNYSSPVLINGASGPVLANERGREFFVSHKSLQNPQINYLTNVIDNIQRNGGNSSIGLQSPAIQRVQGGYTDNYSTIPPSVQGSYTNNTSTANASVQGQDVLYALNRQLQRLNDHLDKGIQAETVIGYPKIADITKAQERLKAIEG